MNTTTTTRGVSEAMVAELIAAGDFLAMNGTDGMVRRWEKAKAALSAPEPAAQGDVWGYVGEHELFKMSTGRAAQVLAKPLPELGITTPVYLAPPAQPAERVPEGMVLVPAEAGDADAFMVLYEYQQLGRTRKDAYRIAIRKLAERASAMLAASPAAPADGDGKEVSRG